MVCDLIGPLAASCMRTLFWLAHWFAVPLQASATEIHRSRELTVQPNFVLRLDILLKKKKNDKNQSQKGNYKKIYHPFLKKVERRATAAIFLPAKNAFTNNLIVYRCVIYELYTIVLLLHGWCMVDAEPLLFCWFSTDRFNTIEARFHACRVVLVFNCHVTCTGMLLSTEELEPFSVILLLS